MCSVSLVIVLQSPPPDLSRNRSSAPPLRVHLPGALAPTENCTKPFALQGHFAPPSAEVEGREYTLRRLPEATTMHLPAPPLPTCPNQPSMT